MPQDWVEAPSVFSYRWALDPDAELAELKDYAERPAG